ncbi:MAG: hypothetical protein U0X20_25070 [Caldilineaceae bacterium]
MNMDTVPITRALPSNAGAVFPPHRIFAVATAGAALAVSATPTSEQAQQPAVKPPADKPSTVAAAAPSLQNTTNILLLGSDRRPDMPNWRTDVMMISPSTRRPGR